MHKKGTLRGFVGQIYPNAVIGWVVRIGQEGPVWVELYINGKKVKEGHANIFRKDILKTDLHVNGNCGFHFKDLQALKKTDKIIVKVGKERKIIDLTENALKQQKSLVLLPQKQQRIPTKEGYFFIHIPKTAGTSFRMMLYELFAPSEIAPNVFDIEKNGGSYPNINDLLNSKDENELNLLRLVAGHYPFQPKKYFKHKPQALVFLRDPLERAISNLFHLKRRNPKFYNHSFEEIFENSPRQLINMQVRYVSGAYLKSELDQSDLRCAKRRLNQFAFVGITEQFDASIDYVETKFGWKFPERLVRNVNTVFDFKDLSPDLLEKIKAANSLDQSLYNYGIKVFAERMSALQKTEEVS